MKNYSYSYSSSEAKNGKKRENYTYFIDAINSVKIEIIDLIKLDTTLSKKTESDLDKNFDLNLQERKKKKLAIWPIFIIIFAAIACLSFSTIFHLFGIMNATYLIF